MYNILSNQFRLKNWLQSSLLVIFYLFGISSVYAETFPELPKDGNFVVDLANVISETDKAKINEISTILWEHEQIPLVFVTIQSLSTMRSYDSIEVYTAKLFDHWQLGLKDKNYGVILLLSIRDRKARIELGQGWDHRYDLEASDIMQDYLVPKFRDENYSGGMLVGAEALNNLVRGLELPEIKKPGWYFPAMIGAGIFLLLVIISLFKNGRSGWGWTLIVAILSFLLYALFSGKGGGGSYSGGGSSGGGGATGSW